MKGIKQVSTRGMGRPEWLALRRKTVGGSDAAGIIGLSKWSTPYTVWADKTGRLPDKPDTEARGMKNILWRIRSWLIQKLGGYDRQQICTTRISHKIVNLKPVRVRQEVRISRDCIQNADYFRDEVLHARNSMAYMIASEMLRRDLILFQSQEAIERDEVVLRATVFLVSARDASMFII